MNNQIDVTEWVDAIETLQRAVISLQEDMRKVKAELSIAVSLLSKSTVSSPYDPYPEYRSEDAFEIYDWPDEVIDYFSSLYPGITGADSDCPAHSPLHYACMMPKGHDGPHIAWAGGDDLCAVWNERR